MAPLPKDERRGYLEDWTAGYGFKEIAAFLSKQAKDQIVVVGTEGSFGTLPDGLFIYLDKEPNIRIMPGGATVSAGLYEAAKDHPTYFIANRSRFNKRDETLTLLREYNKTKGPDLPQDAILFFEVKPRSEITTMKGLP